MRLSDGSRSREISGKDAFAGAGKLTDGRMRYTMREAELKEFYCGKIEFRLICGFGKRGREGTHASLDY